MSLSTTVNRVSYVSGASQTTFAYPFTIYDATDLQVFDQGVLQTSGYSVTGVGIDGGGNVVFSVGRSAGNTILILRVEPANQLTVLPTSGPFPAKSVEKMSDKLTMLAQQLQEVDKRTLKLATTSAFVDILLQDPVTGKFLRWKDATTVEAVDIAAGGSLGTPVSFADGGTGASYASALALALGLNLALWRQGADIVAAVTITLPNPLDGGLIKITGNTGISALSTTGVTAGTRLVLWFTGTPVLTHGANFYLQGQANYTVVANDLIEFVYLGSSKWQETRRVNAAAAASKFLADDGTFKAPTINETGGQVLTIGAIAAGQTLQRSGTTVIGIATSPFLSEFVSGDQTVTFTSALAVAHGFGAKPKLTQVVLKNVTTESGYSVGDEIVNGLAEDGGTLGVNVVTDATNVTVLTQAAIRIYNKGTAAAVALTAANWKYVVRAWK